MSKYYLLDSKSLITLCQQKESLFERDLELLEKFGITDKVIISFKASCKTLKKLPSLNEIKKHIQYAVDTYSEIKLRLKTRILELSQLLKSHISLELADKAIVTKEILDEQDCSALFDTAMRIINIAKLYSNQLKKTDFNDEQIEALIDMSIQMLRAMRSEKDARALLCQLSFRQRELHTRIIHHLDKICKAGRLIWADIDNDKYHQYYFNSLYETMNFNIIAHQYIPS